MAEFLNVCDICEGFLKHGSISEHFWHLWTFTKRYLSFSIFLENGCIYERFWHFWMFCGAWVNFLRLWRFSRRWVNFWTFFQKMVNFWTFLAFVNVALEDSWISEHFWHFSRRWLNLLTFLAFTHGTHVNSQLTPTQSKVCTNASSISTESQGNGEFLAFLNVF